uniref:Uncharacterized protein n=1 Tax=Caenorhabditis japonica TaxID=281687 RepID=A0A8R1DWY2_CAEJA
MGAWEQIVMQQRSWYGNFPFLISSESYALDSDVVTEDMLDQMITANEFANLTDKKPDQPKGFYPICADEKPFVTKPTLLASCN